MARKSKIELELQEKIKQWQERCLDLQVENSKLREQLENEQISEQPEAFQNLHKIIEDDELSIKNQREIIERQKERLNRKDQMIDELQEEIKRLNERLSERTEEKNVNTSYNKEEKTGKRGRPRKKITGEMEDEMIKMASDGWSMRKIAEKYKVSVGYVHKIVHKVK